MARWVSGKEVITVLTSPVVTNLLKNTLSTVFRQMFTSCSGPGSSVGIENGYGLDGPVIESR